MGSILVQNSQYQQIQFVRLQGTRSRDGARAVREQLAPALAEAGHVVLDLRRMTSDTTLLGVVLSFQRRLELNGRLVVVVAQDRGFFRLLDVLGISSALTVFTDVDAAVAYAELQAAPGLAA